MSEEQLLDKIGKMQDDSKIWVCAACGKHEIHKEEFPDVSCYINSIQVRRKECVFDKDGRVIEVKNGSDTINYVNPA